MQRASYPLFACVFLALGCGDDSTVVPIDATAERAAEAGAEAGTEAGVDSRVEDDGVVQEQGTPDRAVDGGGEVLCDAETFALVTDPITRERAVSAATTSRGFIFGWGDTAMIQDDVRYAELAEGAVIPMVNRLTDNLNAHRDVQVADTAAVWVDDGGTAEHFTIRTASLSSSAFEERFLSADTGIHRSPRVLRLDEGWVAAWYRQEGETATLQMRRFDDDSLGDTISLPWQVPAESFAFEVRGERAYFAWVDEGFAMLAVSDLAGAALGAPTAISGRNTALPGEIDIAFNPPDIVLDAGVGLVTWGLLVDSIRYEVRSRIVSADGQPTRAERVVSQAPLRGRRPTVIAYAGGYAVAYRAMLIDRSSDLRLAFVHGSEGTVVAEYSLGVATFDGLRAGVAVDDAGAIAVGWANAENNGNPVTQIRGARLECGAAWLRCGVMP